MAITVQPADILVFYDDRFPNDSDTIAGETPLNRVAIVVDERGALAIARGSSSRRVELIPPRAIATLRNLQIRRPDTGGQFENVARFFGSHAHRPTHFEAGLRALHDGNLQPLIAGSFFPRRPSYRSLDEFEAAWLRLRGCLKPLDFIFTLDVKSTLSRFIASSTDGAWSHVAMHAGGGEIWESVTSGIRHGPIEERYKSQRYWVAAYRHCEASKNPPTREEVEAKVRAHHFRPNAYNYRGAFKYGWKAFRGDHSDSLTPNSTVLQGNLFLLAHA